jgi:hypothetical protein
VRRGNCRNTAAALLIHSAALHSLRCLGVLFQQTFTLHFQNKKRKKASKDLLHSGVPVGRFLPPFHYSFRIFDCFLFFSFFSFEKGFFKDK